MSDQEKSVRQCPACGYIGKDGKDLLALKDQELTKQRQHLKTLRREVAIADTKLAQYKIVLRNLGVDATNSEVVQKALADIEGKGGIDGVRAALLKEKARGDMLHKNVVALQRKSFLF